MRVLAGEQTATGMLRHGLSELSSACDHLDAAFDAACEEFDAAHMDA